jgi:hypothetical protein
VSAILEELVSVHCSVLDMPNSNSTRLFYPFSERVFSAMTVSTPSKTAPLSESAAKQNSDDIDHKILEDSIKFKKECKILLLGSCQLLLHSPHSNFY